MLPDEVDAVTVTVPCAKRVANPPVLDANDNFVVSLEVQVALAAWSTLLLSNAWNCTLPVARLAVVGLIVKV